MREEINEIEKLQDLSTSHKFLLQQVLLFYHYLSKETDIYLSNLACHGDIMMSSFNHRMKIVIGEMDLKDYISVESFQHTNDQNEIELDTYVLDCNQSEYGRKFCKFFYYIVSLIVNNDLDVILDSVENFSLQKSDASCYPLDGIKVIEALS